MKLFIACFTFIVFLTSSNAQINLPGPCPNVKAQADLDLKRYLGTWYKHTSYPIGGIPVCYVTYSNLMGKSLLYTISRVRNKAMEKVSTNVKYAGDGRFDIPDVKFDAVSLDYSVLATDYENYSIRYNCRNVNGEHDIFAAIMTRKPNPPEDVVKEAMAKIPGQIVPLKYLTVPRSKDCVI